jgi:hypothetical protein
MPISIKTDIDFGDIFYLKSDPDQFEHRLVGIIVMPGNQIKFILSCMGDKVTVWDFEATKDRDETKVLNLDKSADD